MDRSTVEQSKSRLEGGLFALDSRHDFGAASDLVAAGPALAGPEYYSVGITRPAASNAAGADGMASLQALAT